MTSHIMWLIVGCRCNVTYLYLLSVYGTEHHDLMHEKRWWWRRHAAQYCL